MAICTKCGAQIPEGSMFCTACGTPVAPAPQQAAPIPQPMPQQQYQQQYQQAYQQQYQQAYQQPAPAVNQFDHTAEFDQRDISENKVYAMATYLLSVVGVIIALLASRDSKYTAFHVRQAMKLQMTSILCTILFIIPFLGWLVGGVGIVIVEVLQIIAFFQVCSGKAKEPAIVRSFPFMK